MASYLGALGLPFGLEEAAVELSSSDLFADRAKLVAKPTCKSCLGQQVVVINWPPRCHAPFQTITASNSTEGSTPADTKPRDNIGFAMNGITRADRPEYPVADSWDTTANFVEHTY